MVSLDDAVVARYSKEGCHFEILIDPDAVQRIRDGDGLNVSDDLAIDEVFKDARKGDRASEADMDKVFPDMEFADIATRIIHKGDIQLTTDQRKEMLDKKRKQIITKIAQNAINPQTKAPHPPQRIDTAMNDAKVHIDPFKPADDQIKDVLKALAPILPIRFEKVAIAVRLSGEDCARCYTDLHQFGKLTKEEYQKNGDWVGIIELPAGLQNDFLERINSRTKGDVETKLLE